MRTEAEIRKLHGQLRAYLMHQEQKDCRCRSCQDVIGTGKGILFGIALALGEANFDARAEEALADVAANTVG